MSTTPIQPQFSTIPPAKKSRPRWLMPVLFTIGGIVLLLVGVGIGAASQQSKINSYKHQVAQLQGQVSTAKTSLVTDRGKLASQQLQLSTAQAQAKNALSIATTKVNSQYKSKFAALQAQEKTVAGLRAKLNRELGLVAKSTISQDGVYVVGKDIPSGIYHTSGNGGGFNNQCYFATLGSTDTSNILDNNNFNGPETVDLSGVYAFQITGGCTWHRE